MSQLLNAVQSPFADANIAQLEGVLARMPDEWTLLRDRRMPGDDALAVAFVLVHPQLGVALVDLAPAALDRAAEALDHAFAACGLRIPVVVATIAPDEISHANDRLRAAFESAVACQPQDPDWPRKVIDLLSGAEDAEMPPLAAPPDAEAPMEAPAERRHRFTIATQAMFLLLGIVAIDAVAAYVVARLPAETPTVAIVPAIAAPAKSAPPAAGRVAPAVPASIEEPGTTIVPKAAEPAASVIAPSRAVRQGAIFTAPSSRPAVTAHARKPHKPPVWQRAGNDPRAGRFYDGDDAWAGPTGKPIPGSPVMRTNSG